MQRTLSDDLKTIYPMMRANTGEDMHTRVMNRSRERQRRRASYSVTKKEESNSTILRRVFDEGKEEVIYNEDGSIYHNTAPSPPSDNDVHIQSHQLNLDLNDLTLTRADRLR